MPEHILVQYPDGHFAAAGRTTDVAALLKLSGCPGPAFMGEDPFTQEGSQYTKFMSVHWLPKQSEDSPTRRNTNNA